MIHFTTAETKRQIRAWVSIGRRLNPWPWGVWKSWDDTIRSGNRDIPHASRFGHHLQDPGTILLWPKRNRRTFRRMRILYSILRTCRVPIMLGVPRQMRAAGIDMSSVKIVTQRPGYKGLPETLFTTTQRVRVWDESRASYDYKNLARYYLSGYDPAEGRLGFFMCELPPPPEGETYTTIPQALESLKPPSVLQAEKFGRVIKRQGDMYAIRMGEINPADDPHYEMYGAEKDGWLLGTNHRASQVIQIQGQTYARGTITHDPEGRARDHKAVRLGKSWHLIVKNAVPVESGNTLTEGTT